MNTHVTAEIASQPWCWRRVVDALPSAAPALPRPGERTAVVGCGTSWFVAMSYAALRERSGQGETDAFPGSQTPHGRSYDRIVTISRSGTTTEIIDLLKGARGVPTTVITAVPGSPVTELADLSVVLDFADERSVVQTRYATTTLALLRAHLGHDTEELARDGERALDTPLDALVRADQLTFLGQGWTVGLAHEAALKSREAARMWTESYPAMEYRHGPLTIAERGRIVWSLGEPPLGLAAEVEATGAAFRTSDLDPLADLVVAQRLAVALAERRRLDPDRPRNLTRSVVLADQRP